MFGPGSSGDTCLFLFGFGFCISVSLFLAQLVQFCKFQSQDLIKQVPKERLAWPDLIEIMSESVCVKTAGTFCGKPQNRRTAVLPQGGFARPEVVILNMWVLILTYR